MAHSSCALMVTLTTALLVLPSPAAPVPKESEKERIGKLFGKVVDPKKDCQFRLDKDALVVTLPADDSKDLCSKVDTVPKLERTVKGEFVLTVKVAFDLPEDSKPGKAADVAFLGGGVCLRGKGDDWVRFNYFTTNRKSRSSMVGFESPSFSTSSIGYGMGSNYGKHFPAMSLRVTRTADTVHLAISTDGKAWQGTILMPLKLPDECTVQVYAQHSSDKARTVTFSDFAITPRKSGDKIDLKASMTFGGK